MQQTVGDQAVPHFTGGYLMRSTCMCVSVAGTITLAGKWEIGIKECANGNVDQKRFKRGRG